MNSVLYHFVLICKVLCKSLKPKYLEPSLSLTPTVFLVSHGAQRWENSSSRAVYQVQTSLIFLTTSVVFVSEILQEQTSVRREKIYLMDTTVPSGTKICKNKT